VEYSRKKKILEVKNIPLINSQQHALELMHATHMQHIEENNQKQLQPQLQQVIINFSGKCPYCLLWTSTIQEFVFTLTFFLVIMSLKFLSSTNMRADKRLNMSTSLVLMLQQTNVNL
jgi:hypothetical protein